MTDRNPREGGDVGHLRRILITTAATLTLATAGAVLAQSASADPIFPIDFNNVTGSTFLAKPKVTAVIPQSSIHTQIDLGTGTLTGSAQIADITVHMKLLNLVAVTSTVSIVSDAGLTGTVDLANNKLSTTTRFHIAVRNVHLDATPGINLVPAGCRTRGTTSATLVNTNQILGPGGTNVTGKYTIPAFTHCGLTTPLLTQLLSGPNNVLTLNLQ
jgi:hypothetical protein